MCHSLSVLHFVMLMYFSFFFLSQVERLVERVQCSTLLEDRRDACRALKALSKQNRVEVGAQGMDALCQVLDLDRADSEIVAYALDALCNVMSPDTFEEEGEVFFLNLLKNHLC